MSSPHDENVQITVRVSTKLLERADALIPYVGDQNGHAAVRADVWRKALLLGLAQLEAKAGDPACGASERHATLDTDPVVG